MNFGMTSGQARGTAIVEPDRKLEPIACGRRCFSSSFSLSNRPSPLSSNRLFVFSLQKKEPAAEVPPIVLIPIGVPTLKRGSW